MQVVVANLSSLNRLVITICFLCLLACNNREANITRINGTLVNAPVSGGRIYLYLSPRNIDLFYSTKKVVDSCEMASDGYYDFKLTNWSRPGFFDIGFGERIIARNYFLVPGEELFLDFDVAETPGRLLTPAGAGKYNRFLQQFSDTFYRNPQEKQIYYVGSNYMLAPDFAKYIDERHAQQKRFASEILHDPATDTLFSNYLASEIDYQWANDKTAFLWKKWIRNEEVPLDSGYFNYLKEVRIDNPHALVSPAYIRFLQLYIRELHRQLPLEIQQKENAALLKCKIAAERTGGIAYKIALLHILEDEKSNVKSLGVTDTAKVLQLEQLARQMEKLTGDGMYLKYIHNN